MKHYHTVILLIFILFARQGLAQRTENAIYFTEQNSRMVLEIENDLLFNTDSYYTAGIALSYTNRKLHKTPTQLILNLITKKDIDITGFGIQQRIYTPYSIEQPNIIANDRPYSAYVLFSNYSVFINSSKRTVISTELGIGAMGPIAGGEEVQSAVHELLGNTKPIGWENQLNNAFLIDYHMRIEKSFFKGSFSEHFIPFAELRVGTLTDRVKMGLKFRVGNKSNSMMKLTKGKYSSKKFIWEWIISGNLQGVFYDATLQGGVLNKDESIALPKQDVIEQQFQVRMGVNFYIKRFSFRYMVKYNSKDFANAVVHRYGSVNFGYSF